MTIYRSKMIISPRVLWYSLVLATISLVMETKANDLCATLRVCSYLGVNQECNREQRDCPPCLVPRTEGLYACYNTMGVNGRQRCPFDIAVDCQSQKRTKKTQAVDTASLKSQSKTKPKPKPKSLFENMLVWIVVGVVFVILLIVLLVFLLLRRKKESKKRDDSRRKRSNRYSGRRRAASDRYVDQMDSVIYDDDRVQEENAYGSLYQPNNDRRNSYDGENGGRRSERENYSFTSASSMNSTFGRGRDKTSWY